MSLINREVWILYAPTVYNPLEIFDMVSRIAVGVSQLSAAFVNSNFVSD